ncbi:hypothetical protein BJX64DRAFT_292244 [Aspergillus heterothallicus]
MSPSSKKIILVMGATGNQGRSVVEHCPAAGHEVYAYIRNPTSAAATQLVQQGATLVPGDLNSDVPTLRFAMVTSGITAVFLFEVLTGNWAVDLERTRNIIRAAREAPTVKHVILSTAITTGSHESFPRWGDEYPMRKYRLNKHCDGGKLLPSMNAITFPGLEQKDDRVLSVGYRPGTKLPWVDIHDMGLAVAAAVGNPAQYSHQAIDLATEALRTQQLADKLGRALSKAKGNEGKEKPVKVKIQYWSEDELNERIRARYPGAAAVR